MAVAILLSTFGCNNGLILSGPRVYYAMARDDLFFQRAGVLHPTYRTPIFGLVAQAVWASVLCISGTYGQLLDYVIFAAVPRDRPAIAAGEEQQHAGRAMRSPSKVKKARVR